MSAEQILHLIPYAVSACITLGIGWYAWQHRAVSGVRLFRYRLFDVAPIARTTVFESLSDAIIVLDMQDRIVDLNPAAQRLISQFFQQQRVIGHPVQAVFAQWASILQQFKDTDKSYEAELSVDVSADETQTPLTFFVNISPIKPQDDFITGRVILLKNITERKVTEAKLMERTQELELARSVAEHADNQKSQFLAAVSHELRTPLNAIINFNQFVATGLFGAVNPKQVEALEKSTAGARHLLSLINDLLDISKIEAGHIDLKLESGVNLMPEILDVLTVGHTLIGEKPINLLVDIEEVLPSIKVDRRRFRQILLNLMSNAVKFTDAGYVRVSAETRTVTAAGDRGDRDGKRRDLHEKCEIVFAVEDTGPGIPPEHHSLIFEPFRQLSRERGKAGSTGLGLPLTVRLVEAHGGRIWLESAKGEGSTFYFSLPIEPSTAASDPETNATIESQPRETLSQTAPANMLGVGVDSTAGKML